MTRLPILPALLALALPHFASAMTLYDGHSVASIVHEDNPTLAVAARLLARDLQARSGALPTVSTRLADCRGACVVIGRHDAALLRDLPKAKALPAVTGWERYARTTLRSNGREILVLTGSDTRGTVWGVIDLTRELGVSAWEWWADVTPRRAARLEVADGTRLSDSPSVKYRGVFLNDEDWGLQPWAAKTFDPQLGDIGPKTYARIYELLWRLKANTTWPAMHDVTTPFYQVPGNREMASRYAIVVGTSHAEPMMRNNVREWDKAKQGPFNFFTNREALLGYWRERIDETRFDDTIYSVGIRGVHDSAMEGADTPEKARAGVMAAIADQRLLLAASLRRPASTIPQAFTLYKEVLDLYQGGLQVPDDVMLVWPDDNYGYLRLLNGPREQRRAGGAGIYYHLSYWGRPHDHLWLGTTHPALVREQLERAYSTGNDKLWIANVGDIKPIEYLTDYFLAIAFDRRSAAASPRRHLEHWAAQQFGAPHGSEIAAIMTEWYDLAWERKPEFMGFGQTEPTTPNRPNLYFRTGGEEAARRLARYGALRERVLALEGAIPADRRDAYLQLVRYPVLGAVLLNERILGPGLGRDGAAAHAQLVEETRRYNEHNGGKWRHMMDLAPRRLTVFKPEAPVPLAPSVPGMGRIQVLAAASAASPGWEIVPGLGSKGASLRSVLQPTAGAPATLDYSFTIERAGPVRLDIVAVPVHPLYDGLKVRIGVRVDGGAPQTLDYTTVGRSDEWKNNVLTNSAKRTVTLPAVAPGRHTLQVTAIDPGFVLDRIDVKEEGAPDYYGAPP